MSFSARGPTDCARLLDEIKARVHLARVKAGLAPNRELLTLYWDIGRLILDRQHTAGWGAKVIDRLSTDLKSEFPGQQGFSPRNLKYMRAFAAAQLPASGSAIVQGPLAQIPDSSPSIVQQIAAQLSAYQNAAPIAMHELPL